MYEVKNSQFIKIFDELCSYHDRLNVFSDFVKMCSISLFNAFAHNETLEKEYLRTINSYSKKEQELFTKMFAELIMMYEESNEIVDILGPIYMSTKSKDKKLGQVFTPEHIAEFIAEIDVGKTEDLKTKIKNNGFITVMDPACGSGGLVLAYAKTLKKHNINYQSDLLVDVTDISDICVYMVYIQLSLYGIPAIVKCGNTLTQEIKFTLITPFYFLQYWKFKRKQEDNITNQKENIIDKTIQNNLKEVMVKGNCQISLF